MQLNFSLQFSPTLILLSWVLTVNRCILVFRLHLSWSWRLPVGVLSKLAGVICCVSVTASVLCEIRYNPTWLNPRNLISTYSWIIKSSVSLHSCVNSHFILRLILILSARCPFFGEHVKTSWPFFVSDILLKNSKTIGVWNLLRWISHLQKISRNVSVFRLLYTWWIIGSLDLSNMFTHIFCFHTSTFWLLSLTSTLTLKYKYFYFNFIFHPF